MPIRSQVVVLLAAVTAVAGGAYAFGAASRPSLIKACANKHTGVLRLAGSKHCSRHERSVSWNRIGPTGATGAAGQPGATGSAGTPGSTGQSASIGTTTINWGGQTADSSPGTSWKQLATLGTFTKQSASSRALLLLTGAASADTYSCIFQLRVDGKSLTGSASTDAAGNPGGSVGLRGPGSSLASPYSGDIVQAISITADFGALSAGSHTVTLWDTGTAGTCTSDPYNYFHGNSVTILELSG